MSINSTPSLSSVKKVKFNIQRSKKETRDTKYESSTKKEVQILTDISHNLLLAAAEKLKINSENLSGWIELQGCNSILGRNGFLKGINEYDLDPFSGEIIFIPSSKPDQSSWPFITIEGWTKLLNQHPQFCGLEFTMAQSENSKPPIWMECSIYRKDRLKPITVREYFTEVSSESIHWQNRPNRMLRHRTLAQCAKLALGVCLPDSEQVSSDSKPEINAALPARISRGWGNFKEGHKDRIQDLKHTLKKA